jgi:uncharacterized membrane protein YfcA
VDHQLLSLFAIGLLAGGFGALLGVGGGLIIVPALSLLAGLPLRGAIGTSLICICGSSAAASAVYLRRGRVDLPVALELQFFSVAGAVIAGLTAPLFFLFALLLSAVAVQMWPSASRGALDRLLPRLGPRQLVARGASVGAGLISGLLGVGGGILNTPVLHLLLGKPFEQAVATSSYMIGMTAAAGALVYLARGDVTPGLVTAAMVGTLAGAVPAALAGHRLSAKGLRIAFALLLFFVAYQMVRRGFHEL